MINTDYSSMAILSSKSLDVLTGWTLNPKSLHHEATGDVFRAQLNLASAESSILLYTDHDFVLPLLVALLSMITAWKGSEKEIRCAVSATYNPGVEYVTSSWKEGWSMPSPRSLVLTVHIMLAHSSDRRNWLTDFLKRWYPLVHQMDGSTLEPRLCFWVGGDLWRLQKSTGLRLLGSVFLLWRVLVP